jgi:hypothetical protein
MTTTSRQSAGRGTRVPLQYAPALSAAGPRVSYSRGQRHPVSTLRGWGVTPKTDTAALDSERGNARDGS